MDAFSSKEYLPIVGRGKRPFPLAGFWVTLYGRIWVTAEAPVKASFAWL